MRIPIHHNHCCTARAAREVVNPVSSACTFHNDRALYAYFVSPYWTFASLRLACSPATCAPTMDQVWLIAAAAAGTLMLANGIAACMSHARAGRIDSKLGQLATRVAGSSIPVTVSRSLPFPHPMHIRAHSHGCACGRSIGTHAYGFSTCIARPFHPATTTALQVVTGFLGSGKTVLLNRILSQPRGHRVFVIENEAGAVSIDHALIRCVRAAHDLRHK
jgi:hypothetical protein